MVERTNGSPWFFVGGVLLVVAGFAGPLLVDALTGDVQWAVRGLGRSQRSAAAFSSASG